MGNKKTIGEVDKRTETELNVYIFCRYLQLLLQVIMENV